MNIEEIKHLFVPVTERLPDKNGMYTTLSNLGELMIESYDIRHKFFKQTEYWLDFSILTTKSRAVEFAKVCYFEGYNHCNKFHIGIPNEETDFVDNAIDKNRNQL